MRNPVETYKRKFDGSLKGPWCGDLVADTQEGWLVVFYERPNHRVGGEDVVYALQYFSLERPLVVLGNFDERGELLEYQCDAALPATLSGRRLDYVDLDLDLMVLPDGTAYERDRDDFERNRVAMGYTPEVVAAAHEGIALARDLLARGAPPLDGSARDLLGRVIAAQGPL
ncbi:MAG TPA: DUF402 domain-containing protein [Tepidiformaceae bacterium]|nr:DUF402 domain-containing protein [Tepidiformaceae bacterium]